MHFFHFLIQLFYIQNKVSVVPRTTHKANEKDSTSASSYSAINNPQPLSICESDSAKRWMRCQQSGYSSKPAGQIANQGFLVTLIIQIINNCKKIDGDLTRRESQRCRARATNLCTPPRPASQITAQQAQHTQTKNTTHHKYTT